MATNANPSATFTAVLTRPAGQSAELAARLSAHGMIPFEFPLIDIAPVSDDAPLKTALASLARYKLVIFVSPNAIDHAFSSRSHRALIDSPATWPRVLPIGVVGPGSVAALARHGIVAPAAHVISPNAPVDDGSARYDSEALFAALEAQWGADGFKRKRVLIIRGEGGREWLAERLRAAGAQVEIVAAYQRVAPRPSSAAWQRVRALLAGAPHAWFATSSESVRHLDRLAREHLTETEHIALLHTPLIVLHPRIAQSAQDLGFVSITVTLAGSSNEHIIDALIAASAHFGMHTFQSTGFRPHGSFAHD